MGADSAAEALGLTKHRASVLRARTLPGRGAGCEPEEAQGAPGPPGGVQSLAARRGRGRGEAGGVEDMTTAQTRIAGGDSTVVFRWSRKRRPGRHPRP